MSKCYTVNGENYCFYTSVSVLNWYEAKGFCLRKNATLPIIANEDNDDVFQQFIVNDSYNEIQNRSVWIGAHARPVYKSMEWHWINGQPSSLFRTFTKSSQLC